MKKIFTTVVVPSMLAVSTLGAGVALATMPASAATEKAQVTLTGTIAKVQAAKGTFWFTVGTKTYRAIFSSSTKFTKGTAKSLVKGTAVKVTGTYVGKSTSVLKATSISA